MRTCFFSLALAISALSSCSKSSTPPDIQPPPTTDSVVTVAGVSQGYLNGNITDAIFNFPTGIVVDKSGNIFVTDLANNRIRKISPQGEVTTLAGNHYENNFADGQGENASFNAPAGIAIDANGNLYVADKFNNRIRKITPDGTVSTVTGYTAGFADGSLTQARFSGPNGIIIDSNGDLIVSEYYNNRIRRISISTNTVSTIAGDGSASFKNGPALSASFNKPDGLAIDKSGNIYVADEFNHLVRKIAPDGLVSTIGGQARSIGTLDGPAASSYFFFPKGLIIDENNNIIISDRGNNKIRKITPSGIVSTVAGTGQIYGGGFGNFRNGPAEKAEFNWPIGLAFDKDGNIIIADQQNCKIRKIILK